MSKHLRPYCVVSLMLTTIISVLLLVKPGQAGETEPTVTEEPAPTVTKEPAPTVTEEPAPTVPKKAAATPEEETAPPAPEPAPAPAPATKAPVAPIKKSATSPKVQAPKPAPPAEPQTPDQPIGQKETGFVLEPHFGFRTGMMFNYYYEYFSNTLDGGFMLAKKDNRVIWGISFDMRRIAMIRKYDDGGSSDYAGDPKYYGNNDDEDDKETFTTFLIIPGIRVAVARSDDEKIDLTLQADLGFGTRVTTDSDNTDSGNEDKFFHFTYAVGPGLRYWAHPQFAIGAVGLFNGDVTRNEYDQSRTIVHLMSISAALQLIGVF